MHVRLHKHDGTHEDLNVESVEMVNNFDIMWVSDSLRKEGGFQVNTCGVAEANTFTTEPAIPTTEEPADKPVSEIQSQEQAFSS
jgi:hypothetical protein